MRKRARLARSRNQAMRSEPNLEKRRHEVLSAIVRRYIASGAPVGSKVLAGETPESLSPATIRSVMSQLENEGFLEQPYTSAGRVPTDKAYRYYVDRLMQMVQLTPALAKFIEEKEREFAYGSETILLGVFVDDGVFFSFSNSFSKPSIF